MIKNLRVTVDGKAYEVSVEVPDEAEAVAPAAVQSYTPPPRPEAKQSEVAPASSTVPSHHGAATGPGIVASPLAGRVAAIIVTVGQEVSENEHLLTLEAMKMNTFVFAPKSGKVGEILVGVSDAVHEGQALARIA